MKRSISLLLIFVLLLSFLVGCGSGTGSNSDKTGAAAATTEEDASNSTDTPVTIRFLNRWATTDLMGSAVQAALDAFMAEHENVKIVNEIVPGGDDTQFYEKMRTAAATGDMYELFVNYGGSTIRSYVDSDVLYDLTPDLEKDTEWKNSFMPVFSMWEYADKEGTYGVPFTYFATVLFCNKDLFEQYGLQFPKTISEFEYVCDTFVSEGIAPMPTSGEGWRFAHMLTGLLMKRHGKDLFYQLADRTKKYTDPEVMEVVKLIKSWQDKGYFGKNIASLDSATEVAMFTSGKSPMIFIGTWQPEAILRDNPDMIENGTAQVMWFPYFDDVPQYKGGSMGGGNEGLSIAKKDDATTAAAVELLKYLTSKETISKIWEAAPTQIFAVKTAAVPESMDSLTKACIDVINNYSTDLMQEVDQYDSIAPLQDRLRNSLAGMIAGNTPEAAMQEVQDEIDNAQ